MKRLKKRLYEWKILRTSHYRIAMMALRHSEMFVIMDAGICGRRPLDRRLP